MSHALAAEAANPMPVDSGPFYNCIGTFLLAAVFLGAITWSFFDGEFSHPFRIFAGGMAVVGAVIAATLWKRWDVDIQPRLEAILADPVKYDGYLSMENLEWLFDCLDSATFFAIVRAMADSDNQDLMERLLRYLEKEESRAVREEQRQGLRVIFNDQAASGSVDMRKLLVRFRQRNTSEEPSC